MKAPLYYILFSFLALAAYAQQKNSLGMELVSIPAGSYHMGSYGWEENRDEAPVHPVLITRPFLMGATEVTNAQYECFDPQHKQLRGKAGLSKGDDEAVIFVSYNDAKAFCEWLSAKEKKTYRLPTEAEWEYACKAGTYLNYSMDDGLPLIYQKKQYTVWGVDTTVDLRVGTTSANPFGLFDMHGNVEEWCEDWYAPYPAGLQRDPVGPADGLYKVTRGGSHSTPVAYLRSASRMAMIPEDKHWLTGFRVVQADYPDTKPFSAVKSSSGKVIFQQPYHWETPCTEPFFKELLVFVKQPSCNSGIPFYHHNHCPAVTWCDNGDLLAVWFSTNDEAGREMTILSSRLRAGKCEWDEPVEFFKVPDRNMTGSSLFNDGNGTLIHINGVEAAGSWQSLVMVMRTSTNNGQDWSRPRILTPDHGMRHQVIAGMFRTREGWLVQAADATPGGNGGTALHISKDNGEHWEDVGKAISSHFVEGGSGGNIAGIHAGVVQLENGDFMAFGRGNNLMNSEGLERMPLSISRNGGKTWTYQASEFPPIDGGQRIVLRRLIEGPILLVSFTNHPYRLKNGLHSMPFTDREGNRVEGTGMFAALSFDEGKSWPVKKLLTDGVSRFMDGGAWTGFFEMDSTHAEPRGYLAATQTPDRTIHLLSSKNHYRFNLQWLLENTGYRYTGISFEKVSVTDSFWKKKMELNSQVTVPDVLKKCDEYGRIQNFAIAAGLQKGKFKGSASWDDSDLFKALEAASYQYALHKDEHVRLYMDSVIDILQKAQEPDGYLVSVMRINKEKHLPWNIRSPRFSYLMWSHELYNFGHLYESAVAHYHATGQTNLLNVATRNADLLVRTFWQGDSLNTWVDGHPEVETGLLKLWKATGRTEYLMLTQRLLALRGDSLSHPLYLGYDEGRNPYFFQDYKPVKEMDEAYGHGVRSLYLYAAMADMGAYIADSTYFTTLTHLWNSITRYKMYITGGIGSRHKGEAFGEKYELPNAEAYSETCSSIADILWNYKMFRWSGESKYMDICERILYNAFLAGWSLNGTCYNYVNPLESDGKYVYNKGSNQRQPWFETSCCPTNISRFVSRIPEMIYAARGKNLYVNLFIAGKATLPLASGPVTIRQEGRYPWDGKITLKVNPERNSSFAVRIRIPAWTGSTSLPESDLYRYVTSLQEPITIRINGAVQNSIRSEKGYAVLERVWQKEDEITVEFPMPVRGVRANPAVWAIQGKIAIERGPLVYCAEEADNSSLEAVSLSSRSVPELKYEKDLLGGITVICYGNLKLIPYYSWGNRGANQMKVWFSDSDHPGYRYNGLPFEKISVTDSFWKKKMDLNSHVTVPDVLKKCNEYGRIQNFAVAAGLQKGQFIGGASWDDSDLFKALEGASYQYALHKDEKLRHFMDSVIHFLQKAQEPDGYLVSVMRINKEKHLPWNIRSPRFSYMMWSHELYNFGHLYEGAVAHYHATGQTNLLDVATKNADLLVRIFLTGDTLNTYVDGCPEVETGLLKLWKATGRTEYLQLTERLLALRGDSLLHPLYLGYDDGRNPYFFQDYKPIKEMDEAYGHGVRALYLYSAMTDMGAYTADSTYFTTLTRLWNSITRYKMYITGGIGSRHKGEAFGEKYELPNFEAYNETCSSIADILWNYKMFRWSGESKYMDICERILYNAFLAGWALNGTCYNYVNPLESDGKYLYNKGADQRQPWFETSCCPTNISRFVPQIPEMVYAAKDKELYVNLFIAGEATLSLSSGPVHIRQCGQYPWEGKITLQVNPEKEASFGLHIRVPAWTGATPLPESDLYRYISSLQEPVTIRVNGARQNVMRLEKGYAVLDRVWKKGDEVAVEFPMPVRCIRSNPALLTNKGKIAIERGPVVYCAEAADNGGLDTLSLPASARPEVKYEKDLLEGITVIRYGNVQLIPYYSWGNRGANQMKVWIPEQNDKK